MFGYEVQMTSHSPQCETVLLAHPPGSKQDADTSGNKMTRRANRLKGAALGLTPRLDQVQTSTLTDSTSPVTSDPASAPKHTEHHQPELQEKNKEITRV